MSPLNRGATQTVTTATAQRLVLAAFRLTVLRGPDLGLSWLATNSMAVIGGDPSAQVVLTDPTVSRFHCEIAVIDGRIRLRDLGSRNGTVVGQVAVTVGWLHDGAVLQLGNTDVRFDIADTELALPLSPDHRFGLLVGRSAAMRRAFALLEGAARSDASVVLLGETGTGKDAAAESIHLQSARREKPFVVVDCSAIPADLLENELFGHERGAFTGAHQAQEGLFESAEGGTVLLDEIGEMPLSLQPKLLRVLERREVKRVGGTRVIPIDVRLIAATNRDLRTEVNEKRFRADLFYRLNVLEVCLPPLRERQDDLPLLVEHLLGSIVHTADIGAMLSMSTFADSLAGHPWPGNVRELRNHLERCVAMRTTAPLPPSPSPSPSSTATTPLPPALPDTSLPIKAARDAWTRELERRYVETLLARHDGSVAAAARDAGVDRMYFYRLLWRYGLKEPRAPKDAAAATDADEH